jgi:hypothetical protein
VSTATIPTITEDVEDTARLLAMEYGWMGSLTVARMLMAEHPGLYTQPAAQLALKYVGNQTFRPTHCAEHGVAYGLPNLHACRRNGPCATASRTAPAAPTNAPTAAAG